METEITMGTADDIEVHTTLSDTIEEDIAKTPPLAKGWIRAVVKHEVLPDDKGIYSVYVDRKILSSR